MAFEYYIHSAGKKMRCGYTTGTCAALAAAGAVKFLLTGSCPERMGVMTPKGIFVEADIREGSLAAGKACCGVEKDGGDDIDATNGILILAEAERSPVPEIAIDGGEGVGRVTKPGLDQEIGEAAINRVPRRMIREAVEGVLRELGVKSGIRVVIRVPAGKEIAKKTFNKNLGVVGGISILGTSGIVEPMSMRALTETIFLELRQAAALGAKQVILTPGNYGETYLKSRNPDKIRVPVVKCSNFIGDALDAAAEYGFETVLLVGHIGKFVKLAGGIMNTHSRYADCRPELFCAHAAVCGAGKEICEQLMKAVTTDGCIEILDGCGLREPVLQSLLSHISGHLKYRAAGAYRVGAVLFSNQYGFLGKTKEAEEILQEWT